MTAHDSERRLTVRRALLSAYNKEGLVPFAQRLRELGAEILASGGTARELEEAGIKVTSLDTMTGFAQLFGGRLKTLTPQVHGGILFRRDSADDRREAEEHDIQPIDLVAVDLYPYESVSGAGEDAARQVELIDIGGPAMLRAAAKNHSAVVVLCDRRDYTPVAEMLENGGVPLGASRQLARKVFARTAAYDALIANTLGGSAPPTEEAPPWFAWGGSLARALRYGENPGQVGSLYTGGGSVWDRMDVHQGKDLSFNNLQDLTRGALVMREFSGHSESVATVLKHGVPAGTAVAGAPEEALERAWSGDDLSAFGGVILMNREVTQSCAEFLKGRFFEVCAAPAWSKGALESLRKKRQRILISWNILTVRWTTPLRDVRWALDGLLVQDELIPGPPFEEWKEATGATSGIAPATREDLIFTWAVTRHVRSNAIVLGRDRMTLGVGAGQTSRIDALDAAILKARRSGHDLEGAVLASDAFFPFGDVVERGAEIGVKAIVQPGGSLRDEESIEACRKHGIPMYFTSQRVFTH
ncbi:MAG: bifunctional phosphoribosylaminoimidazolecarboxamide formyltransferase/IMP cyclohydrolase [Candidatus Eisenbacteria bacterium]|nr:bifunctional phosphoribosylaminoimidazolecarboxamide formyltransferase/IMP cyclohydrolase [Candidatus Eisenbacteria bacterium]